MKLFNKNVKDDLLDEEVSNKGSKLNSLLKNKKVIIPIVVVLIIVLLLIVKALIGGNKSNLNYYDTLEKVFSSERGYFKYSFDVRTGEKGSLINETTKVDVSMDDLNTAENVESEDSDNNESEEEVENIASQDSTDSTQKNEFQDWNKYADIKTGDWEYPNYKVIIEGNTTSLEPLKTNFKISLVTNSYNNVFTEVYCIDGDYYIDIESMYNYLKNSGDSYLVSVGEKLPNGSKWVVIPEEQFKVASRYAEVGEQELSECDGLTKLYRRFLVALNSTKTSIQGVVGNTGQTVSGDIVTLNLSGTDADSVVSAIRNIAVRSGDFYTNIVETGNNSGLYDENQYKQAIREKDNFMEAMYDLATYLQITDISSLGTKIGGSARVYTNGYGNQQIEVSLAVNYSGDIDTIIQFTGIRSGDNNEIKLPSGSQNKENNPVIREVLDEVCDYLNFTKIKTDVKLEINPDTISDEILERFIKLVNETGSSDFYITRNNVFEFIEKYSNFEKTDSSTDNDIINAKLVSDLAESLNSIVGNIVIEKEVEVEEEVEQYPHIMFEDSGVVFNIDYIEDESDAKIITLKAEVVNKSDSEYTFNTTDISLRTLLNSVHPANNETLLRDADNTFDMSKLVSEVVLAPHEWTELYLYFTPSDDDGHMDLYFGETNCGSAVEF